MTWWSRWRSARARKHHHDFVRVSSSMSGWSLYRCECGETEIDA